MPTVNALKKEPLDVPSMPLILSTIDLTMKSEYDNRL